MSSISPPQFVCYFAGQPSATCAQLVSTKQILEQNYDQKHNHGLNAE